MKNIIQSILIAFVLINFGVLYATADYTGYKYSISFWDGFWYVVESIIYILVSLYGVVSNHNNKNYRTTWIIMASFFTIRSGWEIVAVTKGWDVNGQIAMAGMFSITAIAVFLIMYLPYLIKLWQRLK